MISLTRFLAVPASVIAIFFLLLGCGESEVVHPTEPHSEHDGHDHSEEPDSHEGHEHNEAEPDDTGEMASPAISITECRLPGPCSTAGSVIASNLAGQNDKAI